MNSNGKIDYKRCSCRRNICSWVERKTEIQDNKNHGAHFYNEPHISGENIRSQYLRSVMGDLKLVTNGDINLNLQMH